MKFTKFKIRNFKGINHLNLDLDKIPHGKIYPIVGLNESGKTTILEAINLFQNGVEEEKEHCILHKANSGTFSGDVEITATLKLDVQDKKFIKDYLDKDNYELEEEIDEITIIKKYEFKNADYQRPKISWILPLFIKRRNAKKFIKLYDKDNDLWARFTDEVEENHIPKILYFSDFLFNFPEKIYLENISTLPVSDSDKEILEEYKLVIDDVLRSINPTYSLADFLTKFKSLSDQAKQSSASKIKNDIAVALKRRIIEPWSSIFPGPDKSIIIDVKNDSTGVYVEMRIEEGGSPFFVHERSLGFRWFFSFILFTEFRKMRDGENGEYLFLLDEPASNLHQSSQIKLLSIFRDLIDNAKIIYSTHSHYLLDLDFLSSAFVIKDIGRTEENSYDYRQDIKALPYRSFVADTTNEETHIRPILDILDYVESPLTPSNNVVFFEGKWDYYTFKWITTKFFSSNNYDFVFYPGASADKYDKIFREYLANNRKFIAIFDDDKTGREAKERYCEEISEELRRNIFTLGDINNSFLNYKTESIFLNKKTDEKLEIQKFVYESDTKYNKKHFNKSIETLTINNENFKIKKSTLNKFETILDFIDNKFKDLD